MTRAIIITLLLLLMSSDLISQPNVKCQFFKDKRFQKEIKQSKAKYMLREVLENDSIKVLEFIRLSDSSIVEKKSCCNGKPSGEWVISAGGWKPPFRITYNLTPRSGLIEYNLRQKRIVGTPVEEYQPPIFGEGDQGFYFYVARRITIPPELRGDRFVKNVTAQFIIDEDGSLTQFSILGAQQPILDNEVQKIIISSPKWTPATLAGKPIPTYIKVGFTFRNLGFVHSGLD